MRTHAQRGPRELRASELKDRTIAMAAAAFVAPSGVVHLPGRDAQDGNGKKSKYKTAGLKGDIENSGEVVAEKRYV